MTKKWFKMVGIIASYPVQANALGQDDAL